MIRTPVNRPCVGRVPPSDAVQRLSILERHDTGCPEQQQVSSPGRSNLRLSAAGISQHRLPALLKLLDEQEVHSMAQLQAFSSTRTAAFDTTLKATTAQSHLLRLIELDRDEDYSVQVATRLTAGVAWHGHAPDCLSTCS